MTQSVANLDPANPGGDTGATMAGKLNGNNSSFLSQHGGSSRPSYAVGGTLWLDTSANPWVIKIYDGSSDAPLFEVNTTTHAVTKVYAAAALLALGALTPAANKLPYYTSESAAALTDLTSVARTLLGATTVQGLLNALRLGVATDLVDGGTVAIDASLGKTFRLTAGGNRTFDVPSSPTDGQEMIIEHTASGADRTPAFASGSGGFAFGSDITVTATVSGKTDEFIFKYRASVQRWWLLGYTKGLAT